jgi:radical SAM superfamily enzyme YgiQ (UPF0313 family)
LATLGEYRFISSDDYDKAVDCLLSFGAKYYGFSTICSSFHISLEIARRLKKKESESIIIFGGPQITATYKESLIKFDFIDYAILYEADYALPKLLKAIENGENLNKVSGVAYIGSNKELTYTSAEIISDLNKLPYLDFRQFKNWEEVKHKERGFMIDVGRGCPFNCTFCSTTKFFHRKFRIKSVERVIKELQHLRDYSGEEKLICNFTHDMLTYNEKYIISLCDEIRRNFGDIIRWSCSARLDCLSERTIRKLAEANCNSIFIGIESGSKKIQKAINKNLDLAKLPMIQEELIKNKIEAIYSFILGFPEETPEDVNETIRIIVRIILRLGDFQVGILSPVNSSKIYEKNKDNLSFDGNHGDYSGTLIHSSEYDEYIRKYPEVFSVFYYVKNKDIKRNSYLLLNSLFKFCSFYSLTLHFLLKKKLMKSGLTEEDFLKGINFFDQVLKIEKKLEEKSNCNCDKLLLFEEILREIVVSESNDFLYDTFTFETVKMMCYKNYYIHQFMHGVHGNRNQNSGVRLDERNFGRIELHFHENASFFEANTELDILIADYIDNMSLTVVENHKKNKTYYAISAYDEKNYNLIKIDRRIFDFLNKIEELKKAEKIYQYDVRIKKEKFVEVINTLIDENILLAIEG